MKTPKYNSKEYIGQLALDSLSTTVEINLKIYIDACYNGRRPLQDIKCHVNKKYIQWAWMDYGDIRIKSLHPVWVPGFSCVCPGLYLADARKISISNAKIFSVEPLSYLKDITNVWKVYPSSWRLVHESG